MTDHGTIYDSIVLGGGPAGLQAALTLARMRRSVLVIDSGHYRNATVAAAHNYATHEGESPEQIRQAARADVARYDTVEIREAAACAVAADGDEFTVELDVDDAEGGRTRLRSRSVVLATGLRDVLPDIPGLADVWGREAAACPFCHGYETAGRVAAVAVEGPHGEQLGRMLEHIGATVVQVGSNLSAVERVDGGLLLALDAEQVRVDALFLAPAFEQSTPFAAQLGLELNDSGCIRIDALGATSMPGVFAAGDAAHIAELPMPMASVLLAQASGLMAAAACVRHLLVGGKAPAR